MIAIALKDHKADDDDELTFSKNEFLEVEAVLKENGMFWWGRLKPREVEVEVAKVALFPRSYVQVTSGEPAKLPLKSWVDEEKKKEDKEKKRKETILEKLGKPIPGKPDKKGEDDEEKLFDLSREKVEVCKKCAANVEIRVGVLFGVCACGAVVQRVWNQEDHNRAKELNAKKEKEAAMKKQKEEEDRKSKRILLMQSRKEEEERRKLDPHAATTSTTTKASPIKKPQINALPPLQTILSPIAAPTPIQLYTPPSPQQSQQQQPPEPISAWQMSTSRLRDRGTSIGSSQERLGNRARAGTGGFGEFRSLAATPSRKKTVITPGSFLAGRLREHTAPSVPSLLLTPTSTTTTTTTTTTTSTTPTTPTTTQESAVVAKKPRKVRLFKRNFKERTTKGHKNEEEEEEEVKALKNKLKEMEEKLQQNFKNNVTGYSGGFSDAAPAASTGNNAPSPSWHLLLIVCFFLNSQTFA